VVTFSTRREAEGALNHATQLNGKTMSIKWHTPARSAATAQSAPPGATPSATVPAAGEDAGYLGADADEVAAAAAAIEAAAAAVEAAAQAAAPTENGDCAAAPTENGEGAVEVAADVAAAPNGEAP
jgi:hypothetical protein